MGFDKIYKALYILKKSVFRYGKYVLIFGCGDEALVLGELAKTTGAAGVMFCVYTEEERARVQSLGFDVWVNGVDEFDALIAYTEGRKYDIVAEYSGKVESYEILIRAAKRGAEVPLMVVADKPLNCHVGDVVRDQLHFMGIVTVDDEDCRRKAEQMEKSGKLDQFFADAGIRR